MKMEVNTYAGSVECYDKMRFLVNKYNQKYKVEIPQENERNMLIKLYENRRTLSIQEITDEIRQNVSIYGIFNGYWKQKEMLIKIEGIKRRMQHEVDKSNETIEKVKSKIQSSNKALVDAREAN